MFQPRLNRRQFSLGLATLLASTGYVTKASFGQEEKVLRVRVSNDIANLDPAFRPSAVDERVSEPLFRKLIRYTPNSPSFEWELDLAESIEQVDDLSIRFRLRPGTLWSDGSGEVTADDVKFSYERFVDPALNAPYRDDWGQIERVDVEDTYSGVIRLKNFFAPLWTSTLPWGSGKIVSRRAVEALGGKFTTETSVPSNGPYQLAEWVANQRIVLERNPHYAGPAPFFDRIVVLPITDEKAAELAYQSGEIDFTELSLSTFSLYQSQPPAGSVLTRHPGLSDTWLGLNVEHPKLADIRVRRAIQKAVDIDAALDAAYFGIASRATGLVPAGLIGHPEIEPPPRDVEGARALLAEAGIDTLDLKLSVLSRQDHIALAESFQASLAEVGITLSIEVLDSGSFWSLGDESAGEAWKDVQLVINRYNNTPDPSFFLLWFTPDQIGVWNWERWNSPEFAALLEEAQVERDPARRHQLYVEAQQLQYDSGAYVFLTNAPAVAIHRDTIAAAQLPSGSPLIADFAGA